MAFFDVSKYFFGKVVIRRFKEFYGLHDDLKIIYKTFNPWPLSRTAFRTATKKTTSSVHRRDFDNSCDLQVRYLDNFRSFSDD